MRGLAFSRRFWSGTQHTWAFCGQACFERKSVCNSISIFALLAERERNRYTKSTLICRFVMMPFIIFLNCVSELE